jgi:type II secretory pathway component PulF
VSYTAGMEAARELPQRSGHISPTGVYILSVTMLLPLCSALYAAAVFGEFFTDFAGGSAALPPLSQFVYRLGALFTKYWWLIVPALAAMLVGSGLASRRYGVERLWLGLASLLVLGLIAVLLTGLYLPTFNLVNVIH